MGIDWGIGNYGSCFAFGISLSLRYRGAYFEQSFRPNLNHKPLRIEKNLKGWSEPPSNSLPRGPRSPKTAQYQQF